MACQSKSHHSWSHCPKHWTLLMRGSHNCTNISCQGNPCSIVTSASPYTQRYTEPYLFCWGHQPRYHQCRSTTCHRWFTYKASRHSCILSLWWVCSVLCPQSPTPTVPGSWQYFGFWWFLWTWQLWFAWKPVQDATLLTSSFAQGRKHANSRSCSRTDHRSDNSDHALFFAVHREWKTAIRSVQKKPKVTNCLWMHQPKWKGNSCNCWQYYGFN